uniref:Protein BCCIP homolog n=2 Tax=Schistosoma mansoni TaxID=6183 RepID=A0A3Q0KMV0_SCHMA
MPKKVAKVDNVDTSKEIFNLELEGFPPDISDRDSITILLKHLFPNNCVINVENLAEYIVTQDSIGTVVKPTCDDESDDDSDDDNIVFAVTSVVDLSHESAVKHSVVKDLRNFILEGVNASKNVPMRCKVEELLDKDTDCKSFLLINERFENLPLSICAEAVSALPSEFKSSNLLPTHLFILSWAYSEEAKDNDKKYEFAYPEIEFIVPHALHVLELDHNSLTRDGAKIKQCSDGDDDERTNDFNTLLLIIIPMDRFHDMLTSLASHV